MDPIPFALLLTFAAIEASGNGCHTREATGDDGDPRFEDLPQATQIRYLDQARMKLLRLSAPALRRDLMRWVMEMPS